MKSITTVALALIALVVTSAAAAAGWTTSVPVTTQVASDVIKGGGYAGYDPGATAPNAGSCRAGLYNANRSESWVAVKPGTEDLVGTSKIFFEKFSTFYNFHLGSHTFSNGRYSGSAMVTGYDCVSTGTQAMPPSWTNNTDPNVDFDTKGRAYQVTLPFNAFWANFHPNSNIGIAYSDDLGRTWSLGNGGKPLENAPNWSSLSFGFVEDKQWVAVNHFPLTKYVDHVYAAWAVYNGSTTKINVAISRDRGKTFSKAVTVTNPNETGATNEYVYPSVDAAGNVYLAIASNGASGGPKTMYVTRSTDDGNTWGPYVAVATAATIPGCCLANTRFRDGILQNFVASPDFPGHLYVTWEQWDGRQFDVMFSQSVDYGLTWSSPLRVNDADPSDQFQPSVAAGPGGAVAVAFYDRRAACPSGDKAIGAGHAGRTNFCIDTTVQAFMDTGAGARAVGGNARMTAYTWDPEQPLQTIDGLDQMACASHQNPCSVRSFIGDYFGLAVSANNVYGFFVSTHYASKVKADEGGPVYYQQQVLATVARADIGL